MKNKALLFLTLFMIIFVSIPDTYCLIGSPQKLKVQRDKSNKDSKTNVSGQAWVDGDEGQGIRIQIKEVLKKKNKKGQTVEQKEKSNVTWPANGNVRIKFEGQITKQEQKEGWDVLEVQVHLVTANNTSIQSVVINGDEN